MLFSRWWLRLKQSRGHGIHSPFAFDTITNVLHAKYGYYAFQDIPKILTEKSLQSYARSEINHLSFRLVNHFKAKRILELNAAEGVNTRYLVASSSDIRCTCVATVPEPGAEPYDAIFINLEEKVEIENLSIDALLQLSHENSCWAIYPINNRLSKQFWSLIVKDERISITFDRKIMGLAFIRPSFHKMHYFV